MSKSGYDYLKVKRILGLLTKPKTLLDLMYETKWSYVTVRRYIDFMEKEGLVKKKPIRVGKRVVKVFVERVEK